MPADAPRRLVLRIASSALLLALCIGVSGCSLFNKRQNNEKPAEGAGAPPPKFPTSAAAPTPAPTANAAANPAVTNPANQGAILAGRVIDGFSRPPGNTSIRWVNLDENKDTENDVSVTPEGYFTIQGLKPGGHYKLVARGKQGERLLAGISYATAPNIRVLIQVRDDLPNGSTPPVQGPPVASPQSDVPKTSGTNQSGTSAIATAIPSAGGNEPNLPVAINVVTPRAQQTNNPPAQNWQPVEQKPQTWPPILEIPRRPAPPPLQIPNASAPPELKSPPAFPANVSEALQQARIPSCVRVGDRIVNFALNDVGGQPWELRHRTGKLVLVDFWRTDCLPCLHSLPYLRDLEAKYRSQGLEIVGVAAENDGSPQQQAYRVMEVARRYGVNYRQLLSVGGDCPVRKEFRVNLVPTLFLIDEQGFIIWQTDHHISPAEQHAELERLIQRRLNTRAY